MDHLPKPLIFALRIATGWLFFWNGLQKVLAEGWSAAEPLLQAQFLPEVFAWFADPARVGIVSDLNAWGLLLIGAALILGIRVRITSILGILLMVLYYFLSFNPPFASGTGFLVDRHIIYTLVLLVLYAAHAGQFWGLDRSLVIKLRD